MLDRYAMYVCDTWWLQPVSSVPVLLLLWEITHCSLCVGQCTCIDCICLRLAHNACHFPTGIAERCQPDNSWFCDPSNMELPLHNGSINHFCLCTLYIPTSSLTLFFNSSLTLLQWLLLLVRKVLSTVLLETQS